MILAPGYQGGLRANESPKIKGRIRADQSRVDARLLARGILESLAFEALETTNLGVEIGEIRKVARHRLQQQANISTRKASNSGDRIADAHSTKDAHQETRNSEGESAGPSDNDERRGHNQVIVHEAKWALCKVARTWKLFSATTSMITTGKIRQVVDRLREGVLQRYFNCRHRHDRDGAAQGSVCESRVAGKRWIARKSTPSHERRSTIALRPATMDAKSLFSVKVRACWSRRQKTSPS